MRRFLSLLMAAVMAAAMLPLSASAEEAVERDIAAAESASEIPENYGMEVTQGSKVYYIEDGDLLCSTNSGKPVVIDNNVTWVIEEGGMVYYSMIDGYNTYIYKADGKEEIAKIFCPVDCFDVEGEYVYYSYNGEVIRLDTVNSTEESIYADKNLKNFYLNSSGIVNINASYIVPPYEDEVELFSLTGKTGSDFTNNPQIASKLTELFNLLPYSNYPYFTTYGNKDCCSWSSNGFTNGKLTCYYCNSDNVCKEHPTLKTTGMICKFGAATTCYALGKYAFQYIFGEAPTGIYYYNSLKNRTGTYNTTVVDKTAATNSAETYKNILKQAKTGDLIVTNSHTMVFLSCDEDGFNVLQCNQKGHDLVTVDKMPYTYFTKGKKGKSFPCVLYHYNNYPVGCENCVKAKTKNFKYYGDGICSNCKSVFNYTATEKEASEGLKTGIYKRTGNKYSKLYFRPTPYATGEISRGAFSSIEILGAVYNADGGKWYKVNLNGQTGYIVAYKVDADYTYESSYGNSKISIDPKTCPIGTIQPKSFSLQGTITSEKYNIVHVKGEIINAYTDDTVLSGDDYPKIKSYDIRSGKVNSALKFNTLKDGTYYLRYTAWDETDNDTSKGNPKVWESEYFNVAKVASTTSLLPKITVASIEKGQRATITCGDGNALIHVTSSMGETSGYNSVTVDFTTAGSHIVNAWTTTSGKTASSTVTSSIYVSQMESPYINDAKYSDNGVLITISGSGDIYYTTDGSAPTAWSNKYTGPIYIDSSKTIKAISASYGCVNSDTAARYVNVTVPSAPSIVLNTENKVAQGKTVSVSWNETERATSYSAYLLKNGKEVKSDTTTGLSASFVLDEKNDDENIEYEIKVTANNFKGSSNYSNGVTVTAMRPVTVTIVDKVVRENGITDEIVAQIQQRVNKHDGDGAEQVEGNVISAQKIEYGTKPSRPSTPSKKGFTFAGYSEGLYYAATEDITVDALFEINYYTVEFWNSCGENNAANYQIGDTQEIMYTDRAVPPTGFTYPTGYVLAGWSVDSAVSTGYDYTYVDGNIKLYTSYTWENADLPTIVEITGVSRDEKCTSYAVNMRYTNNNFSGTQARLIVSLYTTDGRMVYTQTKDVDMDAFEIGKSVTDSVQLNYVNKISKVSAVMVQVKNDLTGGAVSEMAYSEDIEFPDTSGYWGAWSDWSTSVQTESGTRQIETKTQYRYVYKTTTTSNASTLDGWNLYDKTEWVGNWSDWSQTYVSAFENEGQKREVESYWEPATYKTQYHYFTYYKGSSAPWTHYSSSHPYLAEIWVDSQLPWNRYSGGINQYGGSGYDFGYPFNRWLICDGTTYGGSGPWTRDVQTGGGYSMYRYRDTCYTYYFWKWGDWSDWSDTVCTAASDRQVETRTVYRYRDYFQNYPGYDPSNDSTLEEQTAEKYEIEGNLTGFDNDLSGKTATVMVYKKTNTDPTQEQLQYVEQITLGNNNSYSFTVNPKEEIDYVNTGDYIVTLSVEGCERLVNIDVIKAEVPTYEVVFYSENGVQFGDTQYVEYGGGVDVNAVGIPEKDGYRFVKWNKSVVDITKNTSVTAVFEKEAYSVVFVDHENETAQITEVLYGDPIVLPTVESVEGKEFMGWDLLPEGEEAYAAESMVVTAVWNTLSYTVKFCDMEGNVVSEQTVSYGEAAEMPEFVEVDGVICSWDISNCRWWNVTSDMTVYPHIPQTVQVAPPTINVSTEEAGGMFYADLETAQDGGTIYYSVYSVITPDDAKAFAEGVMLSKEQSEDTSVLMSAAEEPEENSYLSSDEEYIREYTESVQITEGTVIYAFTMDGEGNVSPVSLFEYGYLEESDGSVENVYEIDPECPVITLENVRVKPGEEVSVPITVKNNPGVTNLSIILDYDMNNLLLSDTQNGDLFNDDGFSYDEFTGGSYKLTWASEEAVTTDGTLAALTFIAGDEEKTYDIKLYVDDVTAPDEEENPFAAIDGKITVATDTATDKNPTVSVCEVTGRAGDTVVLPIMLSNNTGIAGLNLKVNFDNSVLEPVTVEKGDALSSGTIVSNLQQGGDLTALEYVTAFWYNPSDITENGEILLVTFTIKEGAQEGVYPVTVTYEEGDITNQNYDDVKLNVTNGSIEVMNYITGDVYKDGKVNTKDSVRLGQYLADWAVELSEYELKSADIYVDNKINTKDSVKLAQYLADWDVTLMRLFGIGDGEIIFEAGKANAADGYVDIPVSVSANSGVAGFKLKIKYDNSLLTPVSVTKGNMLATGTMTSNIDQGGDLSKLNTVSVFWSNPSNVTATGTAFTVRFKVADNATENIPVTLSYEEGDICDQNYNDLGVTLINGEVILTDSVTVTMDGKLVQTNGTITLGQDDGRGTYSLPDDVVGYCRVDAEGTAKFVDAGKYNVVGGEIITSALMNVTMVDGAQVRYGGGIDADGKINSGNGLRFLAVVDRSSVSDGEAVAYGMKITAEGSDKVSVVEAKNWQSDDVFTVAVTDLYKNNYNRNYTATPFVKVKYTDGTERIVYGTQSITRSVYYVATGLLKNGGNGIGGSDDKYGAGESRGLYEVLNAYVNMVGVRLNLDSRGTFTARTEGSGAYTGEVFFDVTSIDNGDGSYTITVTPITEKFEYPVRVMSYWDEFVRINNNNSKVRANISDVRYNENGGVTFKFTMPQ